jgi:hypothetical protein
MSTYTVLPGTMNLSFKRSADFAALVDFDVNLTGYTVSASLVSLVSSAVVQAFTASISDAAAGQVSVSLTDTQTAALAAGTYGWQLDWVAPGSVQRTALSGTVEVAA